MAAYRWGGARYKRREGTSHAALVFTKKVPYRPGTRYAVSYRIVRRAFKLMSMLVDLSLTWVGVA